MWFKNLQILRVPTGWTLTAPELETQLRHLVFQPCGGSVRESLGWIPPRGDDRLVYALRGQWLVALGVEQKLLPASVVKQHVEARAAELESRMGVRPGRKRMRELKDEVTDELLPRAFSRYRTTFAWIDPVNGWLAVDAGSSKKQEEFTAALRRSLDEFPIAPLKTRVSPQAAMTEWLVAREAPAGMTIDRECALQSPLEEKATVRYTHHPLTDTDEIRNHIAGGKLPIRLALTWQDRVSFVLTDRLEVRKLAFLDVVEAEAGPDTESAEEQFESDFTLMTGLLARFLTALTEALGGEAS
jgi:recombination associated protein RdgC